MFDRVSEISKRTLTNGEAPSTGALDAGPLESLLAEEEEIVQVLASNSSVKHTTDDKTVRIEPGEDWNVYLVVTNRRLFVVMGSDPDDPEIEMGLADVTNADLKESLLKSSVVVRTPDQRVAFVPGDLDAGKAVVSYVSRIGSAWADLYKALAKVDDAMDDVTASVERGDDPTSDVQRAQTRISNAYHCATHYDDAPTALMKGEIEPVESELERMQIDPRLDRIDDLLAEATEAREDENYEEAFAAVVEGTDEIAATRETLEMVEGTTEEADDRLDDLDIEFEEGAETMLDGAEQACHRALEADGADDAVAAWDAALDRYRGALAAELDGVADVDQDSLQFQLAWVVGNLIDALEARAAEREAEGDDLGEDHEDAAEHYEVAHDDLERARALAADHPHGTPEQFEDALETVADKRDRAEWEWGTLD